MREREWEKERERGTKAETNMSHFTRAMIGVENVEPSDATKSTGQGLERRTAK